MLPLAFVSPSARGTLLSVAADRMGVNIPTI